MAVGFDGALLIRHAALLLATVVVYLLQERLQADNTVLWVIGLAAALNVLPAFVQARGRGRSALHVASFVVGIAGWTALVRTTGGTGSPFVGGFWLEIMLSAMGFTPIAPVLVALVSIVALWLQALPAGWGGMVEPLVLHSGLLAVMGLATYLARQRWRRTHGELERRQAALQSRMKRLEQELQDAHELGEVGRNVARLAHGLKNAVHSLRGFAKLLEPRITETPRGRPLMAGLTESIDRLEQIARECLGPAPAREERTADVRASVASAIREVSVAHPEVRWAERLGPDLPRVDVPPEVLREVLEILVRNAAEAMDDGGEALVRTTQRDGLLHLEVCDSGPGMHPDAAGDPFRLGYTTKPGGSGFGLFLGKRLLETHGGSLKVGKGPLGGARLTATLPLSGFGER